MNTNTTNII